MPIVLTIPVVSGRAISGSRTLTALIYIGVFLTACLRAINQRIIICQRQNPSTHIILSGNGVLTTCTRYCFHFSSPSYCTIAAMPITFVIPVVSGSRYCAARTLTALLYIVRLKFVTLVIASLGAKDIMNNVP